MIPDQTVGEAGSRYRAPEVQFLEEKYAICFGSVITRGEFISALAKVLSLDYTEQSSRMEGITQNSEYFKAANALYKNGVLTERKLDVGSRLTSIHAVALAVRASGLKEVADTYHPQKTDVALSKLGLSSNEILPPLANELAVAIDSGLLPPSGYEEIACNASVTPELAAVLLARVLSFHGEYSPANYLGYIVDEDIYGKVYTAWKNANLDKSEKLLEAASKGIAQGLITGYNLRVKNNTHRFDERRTIRYGHSSITHALQLIAVLKSEGLNAKVQFESKTSAYIYLKEWGEPTITTDFAVSKLDNGNYVAYAKEYDISFEFQTVEQKQKFETIIFKYAKKDRTNQQGLIYDAWWKPVYTSLTPITGYQTITDHVITDDHYEIHILSLTEKSLAVIAGLMAINPNMQINAQTVWVDKPFYQYLLGEYK